MTLEQQHSDVATTLPRRGAVTSVDYSSYINWPGILAGAAIAMAMSFVLLAFGSAIGLAVASPWESNGLSTTTVGLGAGIFVALVQIWAVSSGAYLTGRLRPQAHDSVRDEVRFRDGVNGLVVWAVTVLLGAVLASSLISGALTNVGQTAAAVANTASSAIAPVAERTIDLAFRVAAPAEGDRSEQKASPPQSVSQSMPELTSAERERLNRIFIDGLVDAEFDARDRAFVERLIVRKTGIAPDAARARVTEVINEGRTTAKEVTETARKAGAIAGFWTALVFLLSGLAAWWAGSLGGLHRDEGSVRTSTSD